MTNTTFTRGEMERNLSQTVQAFYRHQLGCKIEKVSCHLIDEQIAIAIKNPITPVEKLLSSREDINYAQDLRDRLDSIIKNELLPIMETVLGVQVVAMTIDTNLDNNLTGIVALLAQKPKLRDAKRSHSKSKVSS